MERLFRLIAYDHRQIQLYYGWICNLVKLSMYKGARVELRIPM